MDSLPGVILSKLQWPCACDYKYDFRIGGGAFCGVYQQCDHVARKELIDVDENFGQDFIEREVLVYKRIGTPPPQILEFYGHSNDLMIRYFRYYDSGDISDCFWEVSRDEIPLPPLSTRWQWIIDVTKALKFLHSIGVIHRDLSPGNVLLSDNRDHAILCDFGHSHLSTLPPFFSKGFYGFSLAIDYEPPSIQQDLFATGCLAWYIIVGRIPFHEILEPDWCLYEGNITAPQSTVRAKYLAHQFPPFPSCVPQDLANHIMKCWKGEYNNAGELLEDLEKGLELLFAIDTDPWYGYNLLTREQLLAVAVTTPLPEDDD